MTELPPTAARLPRASRLARRFDRLRVKLFLAIAGTNAVVAAVAYLLFSLSFDRGLMEYVHRNDLARLDTLVAALASDYRREGGWQTAVEDREAWMERVRDALGLPQRDGEPSPMPPREFPLTVDPRLMLFDAERQLLIGRAERAREAVLKPIHVDGATVGYLGYVPHTWLFESIARLASLQQHGSFAAIGVGMLAAALLLGAGLAQWLTRRIRALAGATAALSRGDYDIRLNVSGHDELAQLARDFNRLASTLAATRRARTQWVADIAHELRTPLAVLRGEIEALQDGVRPLSAESLASLAQETARLHRLVDDLHLLSTSDLGALSYHTRPLDTAEVLDEVVRAHRLPLKERGLTAELDLQAGIVLGDAARLAQVYGNLMQNTLRYTDAGGRLRIGCRTQGEHVLVEWEDSSPGVPESELPHLTERLYRVDGSRNRASGGSGLGLAIAKAIVEAHHGTMTPSPSELGGLRWRIVFPRHG
ncbi:MAG: ATP-binding protein [Pseudomonadota bacterium]